jgi:hypothetical protein
MSSAGWPKVTFGELKRRSSPQYVSTLSDMGQTVWERIQTNCTAKFSLCFICECSLHKLLRVIPWLERSKYILHRICRIQKPWYTVYRVATSLFTERPEFESSWGQFSLLKIVFPTSIVTQDITQRGGGCYWTVKQWARWILWRALNAPLFQKTAFFIVTALSGWAL